jgi:hypothetical protein
MKSNHIINDDSKDNPAFEFVQDETHYTEDQHGSPFAGNEDAGRIEQNDIDPEYELQFVQQFTEVERQRPDGEMLLKLGINIEDINALPCKSNGTAALKNQHMQAIRQESLSLEVRHGTPMLRAQTILHHLKEHGLGVSAAGTPLRKANALGDVLGRKGLNLPWVKKGGRKYYALSFLDASDQEKAEAQARLDALSSAEKKVIKIA